MRRAAQPNKLDAFGGIQSPSPQSSPSRVLPTLKSLGMHTAIGGISLPNQGSVALHERFGFEKVGHFAEVGYKLGQWIDVGYWQVPL